MSPGPKKYPVLRYEYREGDGEKELVLKVFADSDWAGCKESRKSRSGGIALLGGGVVESWSNRQATPARPAAKQSTTPW